MASQVVEEDSTKNKRTPDVSVVIPVRNDARRLARCLASIWQANHSVEVIVVDNGSTDDSVAVAKSGGATVLSYPELRVGALRNRGVAASTGEVLGFVDSDHTVAEDWIEAALRVFREVPGSVSVGAFCLAPTPGTWVQDVWAIHRLRGARRREVDWLGAGNMFVLRSAFDAAGGFDESLVSTEDVDLCHRLRQQGGRIILDPEIRNVHFGEPDTLRAFFRKERWRGSSNLQAWIRHGFPLRDLPSVAWPIWHAVGLVIVFLLTVWWLFIRSQYSLACLLIGSLVWIAPACVLALRTGLSERRPSEIPGLVVLYFVYGLARAAALLR